MVADRGTNRRKIFWYDLTHGFLLLLLWFTLFLPAFVAVVVWMAFLCGTHTVCLCTSTPWMQRRVKNAFLCLSMLACLWKKELNGNDVRETGTRNQPVDYDDRRRRRRYWWWWWCSIKWKCAQSFSAYFLINISQTIVYNYLTIRFHAITININR